MWLTILECTPNSNFPANDESNENKQDNENPKDNKNEGNYSADQHMFKVNNSKKVLASSWLRTDFTPCSSAFNVFTG